MLLKSVHDRPAPQGPGGADAPAREDIRRIMNAQIDAAQRHKHNEQESIQNNQNAPAPLAYVLTFHRFFGPSRSALALAAFVPTGVVAEVDQALLSATG